VRVKVGVDEEMHVRQAIGGFAAHLLPNVIYRLYTRLLRYT
jgi:hypothetical protein